MMALKFVGKMFDFLIGGPPLEPRPAQPEVTTKLMEDSEASLRLISDDILLPRGHSNPVEGIGHSNPAEAIDHSNKPELFQWILLLLRLVTTVRLGFPACKPEPDKADSVSRFHTQSYGYLDALATLLLRRDEIVAAVESSPGSGIVMSENKSTPANPRAEVRWPFTCTISLNLSHISVRRLRFGGSRILRYQLHFAF
jgi:hypothetical protein